MSKIRPPPHFLKFSKKSDRIDLRLLAEDADLSFIGADKFSGVAGEVQFKKETLGIDLDGDKSADMAILLPGTSTLGKSKNPDSLIL